MMTFVRLYGYFGLNSRAFLLAIVATGVYVDSVIKFPKSWFRNRVEQHTCGRRKPKEGSSMRKSLFAVLAVAMALAIAPAALADSTTLCPDTTPGWQETNGNSTVVNAPGQCGAATFYVPNDAHDNITQFWTTDGLTLGNLVSLDASVVFTADVKSDQPYFELEVDDLSSLMLEFQPSGNLSGNDMIVDPSTTLFNLWNYYTGVYMGGQQNAHTLDYWLAQNPGWSNYSIEYVGVGTGLDGGCTAPCSETLQINDLEVNTNTPTPEPTSLLLFGTGIASLAGMLRRKLRA